MSPGLGFRALGLKVQTIGVWFRGLGFRVSLPNNVEILLVWRACRRLENSKETDADLIAKSKPIFPVIGFRVWGLGLRV